MGTGKSSVGRLLARRTRREFVDLDRYLETQQKRKIRDIFETDGEAYFRSLEKEAVRHWASCEDKVITTGGGTVVDPENLAALKKNGILITLLARPETVFHRVKNSKTRPLLKNAPDLLGEIQKLLQERKPFYEQSDYYFETDGKSASGVARLIQNALIQNGVLR